MANLNDFEPLKRHKDIDDNNYGIYKVEIRKIKWLT